MGSSAWEDLTFFQSADFKNIVNELVRKRRSGITVFPKKENILRAFKMTPFESVKVVILGQDPYHGEGQAQGLAFSVPDTLEKLPPSLLNIYKELQSDLGIHRSGGSLEDWAQQGVLLLNTTLTVDAGHADSHKDLGWKKLAKEVIQKLSDKREHLVFILWGAKAQAFASYINPDHHLVIMSPHPSPLSAYRGFFGSKPFSQTNEYLKSNKISEIRWKK